MPEIASAPESSKKTKKEKKDKKDKKDKKVKNDGKEKKVKKDQKGEKRERSKSQEGARIRKSKWDAAPVEAIDLSEPAVVGVAAKAPERFAAINEDTIPHFTDEETLERTLMLEPLPPDVQPQEVLEFLNGAVLAVTGNALLQANRPEAPIYLCTLTEEDRGTDGGKLKVAELTCRTPDGANVGMRLNGLEYKDAQLRISRPANFTLPEDGVDPSAHVQLNDMPMVKLIGQKNYCSIFNIPDELTEPLVRDLLSQFGKLKSLKLIMDATTNKIKGYGFFEYVEKDDTELAIHALNGFVCGNRVICVRWMGQPLKPAEEKGTCATHANSITYKIISNPAISSTIRQGLMTGAKASTVVQLINAVKQVFLTDEAEYEDILEQVRSEASKYGKTLQVVIPRPSQDGSYVSGSGVGKIFVVFENLTAARKFQHDGNGRKFDDRTVCAAFYPLESFSEGKYSLPNEECSSL